MIIGHHELPAPRTDNSKDMGARRIQVGRLTRYLYEARMGFLLAVLAADSIATASARCVDAAVAQNGVVRPEIRLIFQTTP